MPSKELPKKLFTLLDLCVSSLRRGHANLLCIVPILTDDPRRESKHRCCTKCTLLGSPAYCQIHCLCQSIRNAVPLESPFTGQTGSSSFRCTSFMELGCQISRAHLQYARFCGLLLGRGPHKNCKNDLDDQT